jgi:hypothetical protein
MLNAIMLNAIMLIAIMLGVFMLNVIMLSGIMLNVAAPKLTQLKASKNQQHILPEEYLSCKELT